jgi:hypothetical protein
MCSFVRIDSEAKFSKSEVCIPKLNWVLVCPSFTLLSSFTVASGIYSTIVYIFLGEPIDGGVATGVYPLVNKKRLPLRNSSSMISLSCYDSSTYFLFVIFTPLRFIDYFDTFKPFNSGSSNVLVWFSTLRSRLGLCFIFLSFGSFFTTA